MSIKKERIVSIIIRFFIEQKDVSYYTLAQKTGFDPKNIKDWAIQKRLNIRSFSIKRLISGLEKDIFLEFREFSEFLVSELAKDGIDKEYTWKIFNENKNMLVIIDKLQEIDISKQKYLQDEIGTANIIQNLKKFLYAYQEYFQVSEKRIGEGETGVIYDAFIYTTNQSKNNEKSVPNVNYLILKFSNAYNVGIILSNFEIDYSDSQELTLYSVKIEKLKNQNDLKMLLFITDIDKKSIPVSVQSLLMKDHNLFFEFIKKKDLQKISIQGLELSEKDFSNRILVDQHRYAQLIFERFMSYLSVISNEIIFLP